MHRKTGYLANVLNVPPLVFRFQYNPELMADKKSFKYVPANSFGEWGFDKTIAASGVIGTLGGIADDIKDISSLLVGVKPLKADEGQDREISLDFQLYAGEPMEGVPEADDHLVRESIEPDLAVLRSFMYPTWDLVDVGKMIFTQELVCWNKPPECTFSYGGLSLTCVMTSLNIKTTAFNDDGTPRRAEVSVSLKEQPWSFSPLFDMAKRYWGVLQSYDRLGVEDVRELSGWNTITGLFD
jgi:hypothetical protein